MPEDADPIVSEATRLVRAQFKDAFMSCAEDQQGAFFVRLKRGRIDWSALIIGSTQAAGQASEATPRQDQT